MEIVKIIIPVAGIVGTIMLFVFGNSPNNKKGSATYLYTEQELKALKLKEAKVEGRYKLYRLIGLILNLISISGAFLLF